MALKPGRYIAHFLGLAPDGKPIYAAYCCVPDVQSDSDLPSFVSVSESTSDSMVSWDSYPPSSYPDSGGSTPGGGGGIPCTDCLARLCVVRDEMGRIVDIYYYTDSGDYVRVPDCGYYGSGPSSGSASVPSSDGGGGGGGGSGVCCPQDGSEYVLEYDFVVFGNRYVGVGGSALWLGGFWQNMFRGFGAPCNPGPPPSYLGIFATFTCIQNRLEVSDLTLYCGVVYCGLVTSDFDITVTGCPFNPTFYLTIRPGRCASGSFVLRPA